MPNSIVEMLEHAEAVIDMIVRAVFKMKDKAR